MRSRRLHRSADQQHVRAEQRRFRLAQGLHAHVDVAVALGMSVTQRRRYAIQLALDGLQGRARREPCEDVVNPCVAPEPPLVAIGRIARHERHPDLRPFRKLETGRHDADHLVGLAPQLDGPAERLVAPGEELLPEAMANHRLAEIASRDVLGRREQPSTVRRNANRRQELGRGKRHPDRSGRAHSRQIVRKRDPRAHPREAACLAAPVVVVGQGHLAGRVGRRRLVAAQSDEPIGFREREWTQQDSVEDAEDCRGGADRETQRADDEDAESRAHGKRTPDPLGPPEESHARERTAARCLRAPLDDWFPRPAGWAILGPECIDSKNELTRGPGHGWPVSGPQGAALHTGGAWLAKTERGSTSSLPTEPPGHSSARTDQLIGFASATWRLADIVNGMLHAESLTKRYDGHVALDALTLTVQPGEVFCLLGANGAGKTTTINLFLNFVQPTSGTAPINGIDVSQAAARDEEAPRLHPRDGHALPQPHRAREPRVLHRAGRPAGLHARSMLALPRAESACSRTPPTAASAPIRRACARRSASPSRSRRARRRCCSTSRRRGSTRRRRTSSRRCWRR